MQIYKSPPLYKWGGKMSEDVFELVISEEGLKKLEEILKKIEEEEKEKDTNK